MLRTQLAKADGRVVGKSVALQPFPGFFASLLTLFVSPRSLGAELEKLCHRLGQLLDYVGAHGTSLVEHLYNALCHIRDITDFSIHQGATVALFMGEISSGCHRRDIIGPPSSLSDEGLEDMLEGYIEVASRVVVSVLTHYIVHDTR